MKHSITFNEEKNTWDDWCLIPEEQIIIAPPAQKTTYIDIPGASGSLDMSTALTGFPLFQDRTGSMTFLVMNKYQTNMPECNPKMIHRLAEDIMEYLHGKKSTMILDDDPLYYYEGRFTVSEITPDPNWSKITIDYTLNPYKWSIFDSVSSNWLWDPFSFDDGVIYRGLYYQRELNRGLTTIEFNNKVCGTAPVQVGFKIYIKGSSTYSSVTLYIDDENGTKSYSLSQNQNNSYFYPSDWVSHGQDWKARIYAYSTGMVADINFRPGRL